MAKDREREQYAHAQMPRFVLWVQDNLLLTLLIIASGYVNGIMLVDGWVPNIDNISTWGGGFHAIGIPFLFAAGLGLGGLSIRVSYKMSECMADGRRGRAFFMAFGMILFSLIEFWASFSQRSANILVTPADTALLSVFDIHNATVSLTAIFISLVNPFASLFWGFTAGNPPPAPPEDLATIRAREEAKLLQMSYANKRRMAQAKGLRGMVNAARGQEEIAEPEVTQVFAETETPSQEMATIGTPHKGVPSGYWTWRELQEWVLAKYNKAVTQDAAVNLVKLVGKEQQASAAGRPYIARKTVLQNAAKKQWNLTALDAQTATVSAAIAPIESSE